MNNNDTDISSVSSRTVDAGTNNNNIERKDSDNQFDSKNKRKDYASQSTLLEYVLRCRDTFDVEPFNEVDSLLFSWLSYLKIPVDLLPKKILITDERHEDCIFKDRDSCRLADLTRDEYLSELVRDVNSPDETLAILKAAALNPRFSDIRLCLRREETDRLEGKQFAGITIQVAPNLTYVAFRGTDSTMTGWKEDCRMCMSNPVPAQILAAEYLTAVGKIFRGQLMVGGHSKGGNLAVYSAANCDPGIQDRIQLIFSHDGPGFTKNELMKPGYAKVRSRIRKTAPQFSVFGMMLRQEVEPKIIYSYARGMQQHNATTWKTEGYGLSEYWYVNRISTHIKNKFNNWVEGLSDEEMELFIDWVFDVMENSGISTIQDLKENKGSVISVYMKEFSRLNPEMQAFLMDILRQFILSSDESDDPNAEPVTAERPDRNRSAWDRPLEQAAEQIRNKIEDAFSYVEESALERRMGGLGRNHMVSEKLQKFAEHPLDIQELMNKYDRMDEDKK